MPKRNALRHRTWPVAGTLWAAGISIAIAGLFARIMALPVRHDEQMYLPVGTLLGQGDLYRDFGFNNLPNLPLLLAATFTVTGTDHYLLTGRLLTFAGWLIALLATGLLVKRATRSVPAAMLAALLLITNPVLLGQAGTLATNNFLPLAFALAATAFLFAGLDRAMARPWLIAAAGLCVAVAAGFKANYAYLVPIFAVAAACAPSKLPLRDHIVRSILPLGVGGVIGSVPVLFYLLRDPDGFLVHVLGYHRGPHIEYWIANASLDGEKILTLSGKAKLAARAWLGGGMIVIVAAVALLGWMKRRGQNEKAETTASPIWPVLMLLAIIIGGMAMSFIPTPAFAQYYALPLPFLIILAAQLYGGLASDRRARLAPVLLIAGLVVVAMGMPRLIIRLPALAAPSGWAGNRAHAAGEEVARHMALAGAAGPVATLTPIYPLEGGLALYPHLVTGPLVYRVGDLIPAQDRRHYRNIVSPTSIRRILEANPPAAVLVGQEGALDDPLVAYAKAHRYALATSNLVTDRYGTASLYVRQSPR